MELIDGPVSTTGKAREKNQHQLLAKVILIVAPRLNSIQSIHHSQFNSSAKEQRQKPPKPMSKLPKTPEFIFDHIIWRTNAAKTQSRMTV